MDLKLSRALRTMLAGIVAYIFLGMLIQMIGDSFHVAWRIIPDLKFLAQHRAYWMLMIGFWSMLPSWYAYDLFIKKPYLWQTKKNLAIQRLLNVVMMMLCVYMWYGTIAGYQTRFLM